LPAQLYFAFQEHKIADFKKVLLPEIAGEEVPLNLVCMHRSQVTPIVIQLRDFLRAQVEQM